MDVEVIRNIEMNWRKTAVGRDPWKSLAQSRADFKGSSAYLWPCLVVYAQEGDFRGPVPGLTTLVMKNCLFLGA